MKIFRTAVLTAMLMCFAGLSAKTYTFEDKNCRYDINTSTKKATVKKYIGKASTKTVEILDEIMNEDGTFKVTEIAAGAFEGTNIHTIVFSVNLTTIGAEAFKDCAKLFKGTTMTLPSKLTTIEFGAFENCKFTEVILPATLKTVGDDVFASTSLSTIRFTTPKSTLKLGYGVFAGCTSLSSVSVPANVTLGQSTFADCTALQSVSLASSITSIPDDCFNGCTALSSISLPAGITKIGQRAFRATSLAAITLPSSLKTMDQEAFYGTPLKSVVIPAGVAKIPVWGFAYCSQLESVSIPAGCTNILSGAFTECPKLTNIKCDAVVPPLIADASAFSKNSYDNATLTLPAQSISAYRAADYWKKFSYLSQSLGIDDAVSEGNSTEAEYFDLNGHKVLPDAPGIYLRRCGDKVEKVVVR